MLKYLPIHHFNSVYFFQKEAILPDIVHVCTKLLIFLSIQLDIITCIYLGIIIFINSVELCFKAAASGVFDCQHFEEVAGTHHTSQPAKTIVMNMLLQSLFHYLLHFASSTDF